MANIKREIKNLQKNEINGYTDLSFWGIIGSSIIFIFHLVSVIIFYAKDNINDQIFHIIGLAMGLVFLVFGVFGIRRIIQKQDGKHWSTFLAALIFVVLTSLGWFNVVGMIFSLVAGFLFLVYQHLENKELINNLLPKRRKPKSTKK